MDYIFLKLIWYVGTAFAVGVAVGWFACRPVKN